MDAWRRQLCEAYPDWETPEALVRWPDAKSQLSIGQPVRGVVIARAPFGVWLDIGVGHPALLLGPGIMPPLGKAMTPDNLPAVGAPVECHIVALGERCEIGLSQLPDASPKNS
jgi:hypothetical protein